jgi:hypothetical protein
MLGRNLEARGSVGDDESPRRRDVVNRKAREVSPMPRMRLPRARPNIRGVGC